MRRMITSATHTMNRRATRDQPSPARGPYRSAGATLPDGVGGTITGGPAAPVDVMEVLARGARGVAGAGAVSGAAQVVVSSFGHSRGRDQAVALSDGSRISFASIADAGVLRIDDDAESRPENIVARVSDQPAFRAEQRARALTSA